MAEEFGQAMATAEMPAEEAQAAAADAMAQEAVPEQEKAVGYDVDLDYNMEWEVETEPAEPDVIITPQQTYEETYYEDGCYDERRRQARRMYSKHLFVWVFNFVCGLYGVDRFVRGQTALGVLKLLTFGGLGMWYLADLIIAMVKCYSGEYMDDEYVYFDILGRYV